MKDNEILNPKQFETNVEFFARSHPMAAIFLGQLEEDEVEFSRTKKNELNLRIIREGKSEEIYSTNDALLEAKEWFESLDLKKTNILCVFGVGLGYYAQAAEAWLKADKRRSLVFLEDDLSIIYRLLQTSQGTRLLKNPQIQLVYFQNILDKQAFDWLSWNSIFNEIEISSLAYYAKKRPSLYSEVTQKILYEIANKQNMIDEYLKGGIVFFRNFYPNLLHLNESHLGNLLFDKFKNIPAIICGAGPSIQKNGHLLQDLQDKALIFAGGSAMNALVAQGIRPHFGAGIDPNQAQLDRFMAHQAFDIPFFYRNRFHHQAFQKLTGPRLYITGSGGYDVASWFERRLGIMQEDEKELDEGYNVVNFCIQIARALGCNPIILVGLDLAYTNQQAYAKGVEGTNDSQTKVPTPAEGAVLWKDIHGNPLYTQWRWIAESEWISKFAQEHAHLEVINATEGGIGCEGIPNISLSNVLKKYLEVPHKLSSHLEKEIQKAHMPKTLTKQAIQEAMEELLKSLKTCVGYLEGLIEELNVVKTMIKNKETPPHNLTTGKAVLYETELVEEPGFKAILEMFHTVYLHVFNREHQQVLQQHPRPNGKIRQLKLIELHTKRYNFLKQTAQINAFLLEEALKEKDEGQKGNVHQKR